MSRTAVSKGVGPYFFGAVKMMQKKNSNSLVIIFPSGLVVIGCESPDLRPFALPHRNIDETWPRYRHNYKLALAGRCYLPSYLPNGIIFFCFLFFYFFASFQEFFFFFHESSFRLGRHFSFLPSSFYRFVAFKNFLRSFFLRKKFL